MLEVIFTIDYEIYGNGEGSLKELVVEPARKLKAVFDRFGAKFVVFVEAAEFERIEAFGSDSAISDVRRQIKELYDDGFEIALHLHPQWCNAEYTAGAWRLDYSEYNLCRLPEKRIAEIVSGSLGYLRGVVGSPNFSPVSFRAGNWLFQPSATASKVLVEHGIQLDSSVFKGGLQRMHGLDYRSALGNGDYWRFSDDATFPNPAGRMLEIPIYTKQVPFWKMATGKRLSLQRKSSTGRKTVKERLYRMWDRARLTYPLKFDFCRMTFRELTAIVEGAVAEDEREPMAYKPLVSIGHNKDLDDVETVEAFLEWLIQKGIAISSLKDANLQCRGSFPGCAPARPGTKLAQVS